MTTRAFRPLLLAWALIAPMPLGAETPDEVRARAEALLTEATQKALQGDAQEVARIDEALALYRRIEDRRGEALALVVRALAAISRGDLTPAKADLDAAVGIFDADGDRVSAAWFLYMAGMSESLDGRSEAARTHLERSLALFEGVIADPLGVSFAGTFAMARFFGVSALPPEIPLVDAVTPMLASIFAGIVRDELGAVLVDLELLDEAEAQLGQAEATSRMLGGMLDTSVYAHLGALRRRQWRLDEAKQHLERSLGATGALPLAIDHRLEIDAMGRLAEIESLAGRIEPALEWNTKALELARQDGRAPRIAAVLEGRGELFVRHDRLQEADAALLAGLKIAQDAKLPRREAGLLVELGNLSFVRGAYESAASRLEAARAIYHQLGEPMLETATTALLFEVYARLGAGDSAASVLRDARHAAEKDGSPVSSAAVAMLELASRVLYENPSPEALQALMATFRQRFAAAHFEPDENPSTVTLLDLLPAFLELPAGGQLSDAALQGVTRATQSTHTRIRMTARLCLWIVALRQGKLAEARTHADAALAAAKQVEDDEFVAYSLLMQSVVSLREEKKTEGLDLLRRAIATLERPSETMHSDAMLAAFFGGARHVIYELTLNQLTDAGLAEEAFVLSERARARALLHQLANTRVGGARGGDPALVARAESLRRAITDWERQRSAEEGVVRVALDQDIAHAKAEHEGLTARIRMTDPEYASLLGAATLDLPAVQRALAADQTLVSYFVAGRRVHAWVLSRTSFAYFPLTFGDDGAEDALCLSAELGHFASAVARGVEPLAACPPDPARAARLYQQLIAPLLPAIRGGEIVLVPHGVLHHLPFAALADAAGEPLVERYALSYLPSASVLPFLAGKQSSFAGRALVLGAPATAAALPPLPGSAREAREVAALWGTEAWLGAEATESRLYGLQGQVDLVHVAAHGLFDPRSSSFSRVALAADSARDGDLELRELLADVDLTGVNLVVLSACDTALGRRSAGDEVVSLARAILHAGSPAVVSTLWRVDDDSAVELMTSFYRQLRSGVSAAESLRQAQREARRRFPDPYHWAAFTLTGGLSPAPAPQPGR